MASQSPRRRELLAQIGVCFDLLLPDALDETESLEDILDQEPPDVYVQRVTLAKFEAASKRFSALDLPLAPILCADTTVAIGNLVLGKPHSREHAYEMIERLQNDTHHVYTAVVIALPTTKNAEQFLRLSTSEVTVLPMSSLEVQQYVESGECMGKAGAYAIQGKMAAYIQHIQGSYSGIMGLPLCETAQLLKQFQVI